VFARPKTIRDTSPIDKTVSLTNWNAVCAVCLAMPMIGYDGLCSVTHLLGDLVVGQGWQEGEGLEHPADNDGNVSRRTR
jgi:hypothetical protein